MPSVVLALTAHPDDAEFFAGGTLAGMIAAGARAHILVATDGRRGSFEHGSSELARVARRGRPTRRHVAGRRTPHPARIP